MRIKVIVTDKTGVLDQDPTENNWGTHLRAVGGQGRRGRGSDLPAPMTGSLAAASRSHTGWDLHQRETTDTRQVSRSITFSRKISTPPTQIHSQPFRGGSLKLWERDGRAVNTSVRMSAGEMAAARSHTGSWDWDYRRRKKQMGGTRREESVSFMRTQ